MLWKGKSRTWVLRAKVAGWMLWTWEVWKSVGDCNSCFDLCEAWKKLSSYLKEHAKIMNAQKAFHLVLPQTVQSLVPRHLRWQQIFQFRVVLTLEYILTLDRTCILMSV